MGNKARRLAYSKYHPTVNVNPPDLANIVLGIDLEEIDWETPRSGAKRAMNNNECSISISNKNVCVFSFRTDFFNAGERIKYKVVGDKIIFQLAPNGYSLSRSSSTNSNIRTSASVNERNKELRSFEGKIFPLCKFDNQTFYIVRAEGR